MGTYTNLTKQVSQRVLYSEAHIHVHVRTLATATLALRLEHMNNI